MNVCQPQRALVFFTLFLLSDLAASERALAGTAGAPSERNRHVVAFRLYGRS
jgi:hypothetical protein